MKISVFGTGYVGLTTGVCFSEMGYNVICLDVDSAKIEKLRKGEPTIFEPGLEELLKKNTSEGRLQFTTDYKVAVNSSDILFIAVGTPPNEDGSANLDYVLSAAQSIGQIMTTKKLIVTKSTVPVGTNHLIQKTVQSALAERKSDIGFEVISNPEFLREGSAIFDCLNPDRIVVGYENESALKWVRRLYEPLVKNGAKLIEMDIPSAEVTKYAANAFLAAKISIMNELSRLCDHVGADIEHIRLALSADHRIGPHFIYAGVGYGGSCFPKDVKALIYTGRSYNEELRILEAVEYTNQLQRERFINLILSELKKLNAKKVAVWGVAFKPGTDDVREAPALDCIQRLIEAGYEVAAYDPIAADKAQAELDLNQLKRITFKSAQNDVLDNADCLCIFTEWKSFTHPDLNHLKATMKHSLIFDGRNIYDPLYLKEAGFKYFSIGRPAVK